MRYLCVIGVLTVLVTLGAFGPASAEPEEAKRISVFAGIPPAAYFVERVGGPHVEVGVLVPTGQDPHTFDPTPRTVSKLAEARVLFSMGFPFERAIAEKIHATAKDLEVVDLQQEIKLREFSSEEAHSHGAEPHGCSHEAEDNDPHTWMDPRLARLQAQNIADTLIRIDPAHKDDYEANLRKLQADLGELHRRLQAVLAPVKGKKFYVFHAAYGYFGDAYGLKQVGIQIGGKEPTARQLARLIELAKEDRVKIIFAQPQFSKKTVDALAREIGAAVVLLDDLAHDYMGNMQEMATKVEQALQAQK